MTLNEAITHCKAKAKVDCSECAKEHKQLGKWLKELQRYKNTGLTPQEILDGKLLTGWILPDEKLPDEGKEVLISTEKYVALVEYDSDYEFGEIDGVLAWMPLPEPYRPESIKEGAK